MIEETAFEHRCHRLITIGLVQVSSPHHYALWNALSVETLAGDLEGHFRGDVRVTVHRLMEEANLPRLLNELSLGNLDVLGVSAEIESLHLTEALLNAVDAASPGYRRPCVVIGNQIATYCPLYFLHTWPSVFVVRGEGEEALRGIIDHLLDRRPLQEIPSLMYVQDGEVTATLQRPPDLSMLIHPPTTKTTQILAERSANVLIEASRGCGWSQCSFCSVNSFRCGHKWEPLPLPRVLENVAQLIAAGVTELEFADEDIVGSRDPEHCERTADLGAGIKSLAADTGSFTFRAFVTPRTIYDPRDPAGNARVEEVLRGLKQNGLVRAYMGVESGCESQLVRYRRGCRLQHLEHAICLLRDKLKIPLDVGFIMFEPQLVLEELLQNITFFRKWNLIDANQWPFRPVRVVPGSPLCATLASNGQLGALDMNSLSYAYEFADPRVGDIHHRVDRLSSETRDIFYALKVISKQQFEAVKRTRDTQRALQYVKDNALVYLDLMEKLAVSAASGDESRAQVHEQGARDAITGLVQRCSADMTNGAFVPHEHFLRPRVEAYLQGSKRRRWA